MVTVVVPVFNEERYVRETALTIAKAAEEAGNPPLDVIIVNDGSTDRTGEIIWELEQEFPFVRSIHHTENLGIGVSIRESIQIAKYPKFMFVPGDNDMPQHVIRDLFMLRDKADIIMIYILNKEIRGRTRTVISVLYGLIYMIVFNIFVQYIHGPCIYPTEKIRKLNLKSKRFSILSEMNVKLLCSGCTFYEIPGYIQTGAEGSTALSLKNLMEVIIAFFRLVWEVKFHNRLCFDKRPIRIYGAPERAAVQQPVGVLPSMFIAANARSQSPQAAAETEVEPAANVRSVEFIDSVDKL